MWPILSFILIVAVAVLAVRYRLLKRELRRMTETMKEIHSLDTNRQLTIGLQQPELAALAGTVNTLYDDVAAEKAAYRTGMDEIRQSMANISHDLRTPLTSIMGYLKLMGNTANSPEQNGRYLEVAQRKSAQLHRLVNGLFELARLESGGDTFSLQRLDAAMLLGEELAGVYTQMEERGIAPAVRMPAESLWVIGDKAAFSRIFANLLQNMLKHGGEPFAVSAARETDEAVFRFSNGAPQLTEVDAKQLFKRFFTADRMRSGENTGLGLSIVKEFSEQMNGSVQAVLDQGTLTFTLRWPLA